MTALHKLTVTKVAFGLVAVAMAVGMLFAVAAPRAQAVTLSELVELFIALEVISPDKADEARAVLSNQGGSTGGSTGSTSCEASFTENLKVGSQGGSVLSLQKFLNSSADTQVAASGVGSPGMETTYFGPLTAAAVSKFQVKYASEILTPLGLTSGTGFWGASSRAKANTLCTTGGGGTTPPPPPPGTPGGDDDDDDDDDSGLSGGEASLESFDVLSDPSDEELEEGDEDVAVMGFEFDVEDGDVSVRRVDVRFEELGSGTTQEDEPWKVFDNVSLWFDGEKIAEMDADSESDWDDYSSTENTADSSSKAYRIRFNGLDVDIDEGDTAEFLVGVTVSNNIDDSDLTNMEWGVWIPNQGVRAIDGAGLDQYTGTADAYAAGNAETFTVGIVGEDAELKLSTASANPDASTIQVDDSNKTNDVTVLIGSLKAEDDPVTLNKIVIFATTSTTTLASVISDAELKIDGSVVGDFAWDDNCTGSANGSGAVQNGCLLFDLEDDNDEFEIDGDDTVDMELVVDFLKRSNNFVNGDSIEFDVTATERALWDAENAGGDAADTSGTINGEEHTLFSSGIYAEYVSDSVSETTDQNGLKTQAQFTLVFDVTAFDDEAFVPKTTARAAASSTVGVSYVIESADGTTTATGTASGVLTSTADTQSSEFIVRDGDTETFTLKVTLGSLDGPTGFYRLQLTRINFSDDAAEVVAGSGTAYTPLPATDFETESGQIDT